MKKLITLLLLFTITLFYSIPTQAYTLDGNDIAIAELNGLTLNEVFKDQNIITNHDFSNGTTGWTTNGSTITASNNILTITGTGVNYFPNSRFNYNFTLNNVYYAYANVRALDPSNTGAISLREGFGGTISQINVNNDPYFIKLSGKRTSNAQTYLMILYTSLDETNATANGLQLEVDGKSGVYLIDLTSLGISSLSDTKLDYWLNIFQKTLF